MKKPYQRRKLFIDRPIQLAVLGRASLYWAMCTMTQLLMVLFFGIITSSRSDYPVVGPEIRWHLQVTLLASVVLLPILLLDILKLSHRWVGPIFRLRNSLRSMSRGESVREVKFRDRDFWQELATELNSVAGELERLRAQQAQQAAASNNPAGDRTTPSLVDTAARSSSKIALPTPATPAAELSAQLS